MPLLYWGFTAIVGLVAAAGWSEAADQAEKRKEEQARYRALIADLTRKIDEKTDEVSRLTAALNVSHAYARALLDELDGLRMQRELAQVSLDRLN